MTRRWLAAGVAVVVLALGAVACTDDGDSGAFCDRLADTSSIGDILNQLDSSDPAGTEEALNDALEQFSDLEADAPGSIRDDVARVRQGVELILEAVKDNPDDLPAAREQIAGQVDELSGLVSASDEVVTYARDECELDLAPVGVSTEPGATSTTEG